MGGRADATPSRLRGNLNGIYKLVAHSVRGLWRDVRKRSPHKATMPGAKQVFRDYVDGEMRRDLIVRAEERFPGSRLLVSSV